MNVWFHYYTGKLLSYRKHSYKPHPQFSGTILEKNFRKSTCKKTGRICSDINKLINSQNTFEKRFLNQFPYSFWLTTVVFIAKARNENDGIWTKIKRRNTMQNVAW